MGVFVEPIFRNVVKSMSVLIITMILNGGYKTVCDKIFKVFNYLNISVKIPPPRILLTRVV